MIIVWWFVIVICSLILFSGLYVWFESQIYKDYYIPEFETEKKVREIKQIRCVKSGDYLGIGMI